ncbi:MAG: hypothetical protein AB7D57_09525 [Desulfovibrionaceae bacterium]
MSQSFHPALVPPHPVPEPPLRPGFEPGPEAVLHPLDMEDLALSSDSLRRIDRAARQVMRRFMPGGRPERLTAAQAVSLFLDRICWEERSGWLLLFADLGGTVCCLPLAPDQWSVLPARGPVQ